MTIGAIMAMAPVIPVLVLDGAHDPAELASALVGAGLPVIEVTLRTPGALAAIAGDVGNPRRGGRGRDRARCGAAR